MSNYNVLFDKTSESWKIKRDRAERLSGLRKLKAVAERYAKHLCKKSGGGEVRIFDRKGKIKDSDTVYPGRDPFPPRDKIH